MTTVDTRDALLADLTPGAPPTVGAGAIVRLRARAAEALAAARLPGHKDEMWRFPPLTAPLEHRYQPVVERTAGALLPEISRFLLPEAEGHRVVFVDGHFAPELSS